MRDEEVSIYRYEEEPESSAAAEEPTADFSAVESSSNEGEAISIKLQSNSEEPLKAEDVIQDEDTSEEAEMVSDVSGEEKTSTPKESSLNETDASEPQGQSSEDSSKDEPET